MPASETMTAPVTKFLATAILAVCWGALAAGCAALEGLAFGLDVANADTTISVSYGDGKGVVAAEQGGNRIGFNVRR
jgi:hypothetical protein